MNCERCGRAITNPESQKLGIGPTCLERMRQRGLVVGGTPRLLPKPKERLTRSRATVVAESQLALEFA